MVSTFSDYKKQLVRDMGFTGMLNLPCINKLNLRLSSWLLTKLDIDESSLVFSDTRRIFAHEKDVGIVFDIPCGYLDVSSADISQEQIDIIRSSCALHSRDKMLSLKDLDVVLEKHLDDKSSRQETDRFKVAFVMFVMGHLLAPSAKHDYCSTAFWGALKDPDQIDKYNWCHYVFASVLGVATKAREEVLHRGRVLTLTGCHLFLQVSTPPPPFAYCCVHGYVCDVRPIPFST